MKKICTLLIFLVVIFCIPLLPISPAALALPTIDQVNPFTDTGFEAGQLDVWQQEITVGVEGYLIGIDLYWLTNPPGGGNNNKLDFFINIGSGWQNDANDFQSVVTFTNQNNWNFIDVSSSNLYFHPGDQFVIGVQNTYDNTSIGGSYYDQYPSGDLYLNGNQFWSTGLQDLAFRTHMETPVTNDVPEPTTMLLLGSGLIGLLGFRRKFRR